MDHSHFVLIWNTFAHLKDFWKEYQKENVKFLQEITVSWIGALEYKY